MKHLSPILLLCLLPFLVGCDFTASDPSTGRPLTEDQWRLKQSEAERAHELELLQSKSEADRRLAEAQRASDREAAEVAASLAAAKSAFDRAIARLEAETSLAAADLRTEYDQASTSASLSISAITSSLASVSSAIQSDYDNRVTVANTSLSSATAATNTALSTIAAKRERLEALAPIASTISTSLGLPIGITGLITAGIGLLRARRSTEAATSIVNGIESVKADPTLGPQLRIILDKAKPILNSELTRLAKTIVSDNKLSKLPS